MQPRNAECPAHSQRIALPAHCPANCTPCPFSTGPRSRDEFSQVQEQMAQVLKSLGMAQQSNALIRGEVVHDSYYKVRGGN